MATFLFVPGAWHGAWCWEHVVSLLEAAGHRALAPELVGMGADRARAPQGNLSVWADQLADIIAAQDEPVFLAGHSRGGAVISEVAERIPDRITALIYITAFLLPDGVSIQQRLGDMPDRSDIAMKIAPDGTCTLAPADVERVFYNTTAPDRAARAAALVGPEPMASLGIPVHVTAARFGSVRRAYIECAQDRAIPLAFQREMQAAWPCDPVITLDCDHSPFYAMPNALAGALGRISQAKDLPQ